MTINDAIKKLIELKNEIGGDQHLRISDSLGSYKSDGIELHNDSAHIFVGDFREGRFLK